MELGLLLQKLGPLLNVGDGRKNEIVIEHNTIVITDKSGKELDRIEA